MGRRILKTWPFRWRGTVGYGANYSSDWSMINTEHYPALVHVGLSFDHPSHTARYGQLNLTPDQARELAKGLVQKADKAEAQAESIRREREELKKRRGY